MVGDHCAPDQAGQDAQVLHPDEIGPSRDERLAATLAVVAYWFCDVIGPPMVLWSARRHRSAFARRYAWTSLALNVPPAVGIVVWIGAVWFVDGLVLLGITSAVVVAHLVPGIVAIQLAMRAWRGEDVRHVLIPEALLRRLPTQPAPGR